MNSRIGRGATAAALLLLLTDCTSASSNSPVTSPPASAASPTTGVQLGTDPGDAAYRQLDVCDLVDTDTARAAGGDRWSDATPELNGPGTCLLVTDGSAAVRWRVPEPRESLPTSVTAPTDISETLDSTPAGTVILDKACSAGHVVAAGYVITVDLPDPAAAGGCSILKNVAGQVRTSLAAGPTELTMPAGSVTGADLCKRLEGTGLATQLSLGAVTPAAADHRTCVAGPDTGGRLVLRTGNGNGTLQATTKRLEPAHGSVVIDAGECAAHVRVDENGSPTAYWLTLALEQSGPIAPCPGEARLLADAARTITGTG